MLEFLNDGSLILLRAAVNDDNFQSLGNCLGVQIFKAAMDEALGFVGGDEGRDEIVGVIPDGVGMQSDWHLWLSDTNRRISCRFFYSSKCRSGRRHNLERHPTIVSGVTHPFSLRLNLLIFVIYEQLEVHTSSFFFGFHDRVSGVVGTLPLFDGNDTIVTTCTLNGLLHRM